MRLFVAGLFLAAALAALGAILCRAARRRFPGMGVERFALGAALATGLVTLFQNVLVHDALWYYSYLRSALVDHDFDLYEEFALHNPHGMYLPPPGTPIFHLGTSLLQAPVALVLRPLALWLAHAARIPGGDGYGPVEIFAATWSSMMLALGGVALTHRLARRVVPAPASSLAQAALFYGSPLAFFAFVWPGYPHGASVFLSAIFLLLWAGLPERPGTSTLWLLGLLGGALALVHPQDAVYLALPLVDLLTPGALPSPPGDETPGDGRRRTLRGGAALLTGAAIGFAPQMVAWIATSGAPLENVYGKIGDPFRFSRPALWDVLFSGFNGLLTWTPLCGVAIAGLFLLWRRSPRLGRGLILALALQWWAIASYGYWWGGASFGARYFLSAYPALGVGLAVVCDAAIRKAGAMCAAVAASVFVYWNLLLMAQFRLEWIPHNSAPDFPALLHRQVHDAPGALVSGLCGPFRWNRVLLLDTLAAAVQDGRPTAILAWLAGATLLVALLVGWIAWLAAGRAPRAGPWMARATSAGALLAAGVVLIVAADPGTRRIHLEGERLPLRVQGGGATWIPLAAPSEGPTLETPTAVAGASRAASRGDAHGGPLDLDLVTFMRRAAFRREAEPVAELSLAGRGCAGARFALRAGIETAETAPDRIETAPLMRHDLHAATPVQLWWQDDQSATHYWGYAYRASFRLPEGCEPIGAELRATSGPGEIEVRRLLVAAEESGKEGAR